MDLTYLRTSTQVSKVHFDFMWKLKIGHLPPAKIFFFAHVNCQSVLNVIREKSSIQTGLFSSMKVR